MLWGKGRCFSRSLEIHVPAVEEAETKLSSLSFCPPLVSFGTGGWRIRALLSSVGKSSSRVQRKINKVWSWQVYLPGDELLGAPRTEKN